MKILHLYVVFFISWAVAAEITDFDMITLADQAVPVRRLPDQFNPWIYSILTFAHICSHRNTHSRSHWGETLTIMPGLI